MTSVTIPSSTGPLHGGYSTSVRESEISNNEGEFEGAAARSTKRCLSYPATPTGSSDSCKKRRKQSTPIRISAAAEEAAASPTAALQHLGAYEDAAERHPQCPVCHLPFETPEQVQNHLICDHPHVECKKEPDDPSDTSDTPFGERSETPLSLTLPKPEVHWMSDIQTNKDWMNPSLAFNPFMAMSQFPQPEAIPMKPIRIFNPDAYCDLCNKEFCNKYFLKTHKANKHGIYSDAPTPDQQMGSVSVPSFSGNMKLPPSVPSLEFTKGEPRTPPNFFNPSTSSSNDSGEKAMPATAADEQTGASEESPSPNVQPEPTSVKTEPDGSYYDSAKTSPGQSAAGRELDLSNRLKRIGVMNPKAFCEICCKEYCNKYFLRTHKMKRHGIYIPDEKESSSGSASWPSSVQTSPLNLIVTEQSSNPLDRKTTSPSDISCDTCGIKFQNAALAQLHNFSVHGRVHSKDRDSSERSENAKTPEPNPKSLNAEAISEDLQKLQTMILQLNDLDVSKLSATCTVCNKEFENRFFLHAHMVTDHGILLDEVPEPEKQPAETEGAPNDNTLCDVCGKDTQTAEEMKKHMFEYHSGQAGPGPETAKEDYNGFSVAEKPAGKSGGAAPERGRVSASVAPTSSYCEICNKELCNKYFMKTHMQRMHGIEIENGAQIGGVVCDICNKELCSKYFLRVHKHNTHGIVEYGASLLQPRKSEGGGGDAATAAQPAAVAGPAMPPPPAAAADAADQQQQPPLKPADLADLSHRYFTHFTEVCPICSRRFRSTKWLKAHLVSDHGQAGTEKWGELELQLQLQQSPPKAAKGERASPSLRIPNGGGGGGGQGGDFPKKVGIQNVLSNLFGVDEVNAKTYQCSYCPFTTPLLPLLFVHERSHGDAPIKCPACPQTFLQRELFQRHVYERHPFLPLPPQPPAPPPPPPFDGAYEEEAADDGAGGSPPTDQPRAAHQKAPRSRSGRRRAQQQQQHHHQQLQQQEQPGPSASADIAESLREVAKKAQLPTTYALPGPPARHDDGAASGSPGYVMQAFLLEESASERRVVPSVVFLPMLQKQPAPLTITFTLTPA